LSIVLILVSATMYSQIDNSSELFKTLKKNDSLLFNIGFNTCKIEAFENLVAADLEFYHDKGGITHSKEEFLEVFRSGICKSDDFKSRRELVEGSLQVYPLYDNTVLYGAIQIGEHRFFETIKGQQETAGSIAKFTHVWLKEGDQWLVKRVLSYDHKMKK